MRAVRFWKGLAVGIRWGWHSFWMRLSDTVIYDSRNFHPVIGEFPSTAMFLLI